MLFESRGEWFNILLTRHPVRDESNNAHGGVCGLEECIESNDYQPADLEGLAPWG